ncbi:MAG: sigma-70 family RNA polymerase sigma factor [Defluviimonas sp.]|nr:sigma-70 family RNA polymerase sigma factor [Defluviimonas sp.]
MTGLRAPSSDRAVRTGTAEPDPLAPLLSRVASGDREAFGRLYSAASPKLFGTALRMLGDRAESEEALQEVFVRIWTRAHRYDARRARAMTWMIAVTRNHCIDRLRARPARTEDASVLDRIAAPGLTPEGSAIARSEARRIADCLGQLEPGRAQAVRGAYLDGLSYEALSARFEVPVNTMRSWLRRGLMKLKDCLEA